MVSIRPSYVFWAAVALLALVSAVAGGSTYHLRDVNAASERNQQVVLELDLYLSSLKDIGSGTRGYALTRDERFLEAYRSGSATLGQSLARLHSLAQSERELGQRLDGLEQGANRRVSLAKSVIDLVANGGDNRDILAHTEADKQSMDQIRRQVTAAIAGQQTTYENRRKIAERQAVNASIALGVGVTVGLLMLFWLFRQLNGEVMRRREIEGQLRVLNLELEDRVQERTGEVKRSSDLLNAVVESLPDMVLLKKPSGDGFRYVLINGAGERYLGRDRSEIIGRTEHDILPPEEAAIEFQSNKAVAESGQAHIFTDHKLTTPTGVRMVETRMVPISSGNGAPTLILAIVRDITDAKAREDQIRQLQRMDAVGQLTGGVAHDFNNLLAIILGNSELLRNRLDDGSEAAHMTDDVIGAAARGADLVRRMLAFSRKQHLEATAVDVNDRLLAVLPLLQRALGESIQVQVNSTDQLWHAHIDPTQVDDALVNLAINARDAMPAGGTLTIETANVVFDEDYAAHHVEVEPGEYVMLAVSDTGTGMLPDVAARAFEPFFTTKAEGKGTGLGLSQVFGWVKQSGGHIKIYSELRHGTTIKLYLPRATDGDRRMEEPKSNEVGANGHETILVVEDNPNVRRIVVRQLTALGYATIEAEHGESALGQIQAGLEFDLLLTDVVMPGGMSGYDLAAEAKKLRPHMKVLFTSGYTELAATGFRAARNGPLISKPYSKRDLGKAIRAALDPQDIAPG